MDWTGAAPARLLLVVDQFEELYTLCPDPEARRRFIDTLLGAAEAAQGAGAEAGCPAAHAAGRLHGAGAGAPPVRGRAAGRGRRCWGR